MKGRSSSLFEAGDGSSTFGLEIQHDQREYSAPPTCLQWLLATDLFKELRLEGEGSGEGDDEDGSNANGEDGDVPGVERM